jgi:hypothetical protein
MANATVPHALGQHILTLTRESSEGGQFAQYSENVRWSLGPVLYPVLYVGLNVQGSNDNFSHLGVDGEPVDRGPDPAAEIAREDSEHLAREQVNLDWLRESFDLARRSGARAVLVAWQADPNFNNEMHLADPRSSDGFTAVVDELWGKAA